MHVVTLHVVTLHVVTLHVVTLHVVTIRDRDTQSTKHKAHTARRFGNDMPTTKSTRAKTKCARQLTEPFAVKRRKKRKKNEKQKQTKRKNNGKERWKQDGTTRDHT